MIPRRSLFLAIALNALALGTSLAFFPYLPDPAPIHWGISGQPDGFGSPWVLALLGPGVAVGLTALLASLPLLGPFRSNFERFRVTYGRICVLMAAMCLGLQLVLLLNAAGTGLSVGRGLSLILGLAIACLGNWMGKLRRNFYVGIRTPWTLANDVVWERTHRLGGRLFVASGIAAAMAAMFLPDVACFFVLMGGLVGSALVAAVYSLVCYRKTGRVDDLSPTD